MSETEYKDAYLHGMHDTLATIRIIIGPDNAALLTPQIFEYYYEKLKQENQFHG